MSTFNPSRNPFADPGTPSIADFIARVNADAALPKRTRQNWGWALRALCRVVKKEPASVPAHPDFLRRLLKTAAPTAAGMSKPAWNNCRSLVGKAMEWAGIVSVPGRSYQAPYADAWATLWEKLPPNGALRVQLTRFLHYCSAQDIAPTSVNDGVLVAFHEALVEESLVRDPWAAYRGAAKSWNNALDQISGWPVVRLVVPTKRTVNFNLSWGEIPLSLRSQIEDYFKRAVRVDLDGDFARPQRPRTIETRRKQLLWFISAVTKAGVPIDSLCDLAALLAPPTVERGLKHLLERRDGKSYPALSSLTQFLPALARRCHLSTETVAALERYKRALAVAQAGMAERHRETLRRFDDPEAVRALIGFADRALRDVEKSAAVGYRMAKLVQTALAVELLLYAPIRLGNLAAIEIERHLIVVRGEPRTIHLCFQATEVKNNVDLEFPLPPETVALLDLYLKRYRPLMTASSSSFLFPGENPALPKGTNTLRRQIRDTVREYTTLEMPPHRFRHAVGKIYLDRNPGQYGVIQKLLGHKRIETTIAFYCAEEAAAAARHYHETILGIRREQRTVENSRA